MLLAPVLALALAAASPAPDAFAQFPRVDQLHEVAADGHASGNANMNCIPASIAAGLRYVTGRSYTAESVVEAVYGAAFRGPTQIFRYLGWVKQQGVVMEPVLSKDQVALVAQLRKLLEQGTPAVITVPSDFSAPVHDPQHPGGVTHVVVAAGFDSQGRIKVMNPWGGVWVAGDDAWWAQRICYGELWPMRAQGLAQGTSRGRSGAAFAAGVSAAR